MLRWTFWLLLLANLVYFAGTQGHLAPLGWHTQELREPQRLTQQIEPDRVRLLNGARGAEEPPAPRAPAASASNTAPSAPLAVTDTAVTAVPTPAPASGPAENAERRCWQAGGFTADQTELLRAELRLLGLPEAEWQFNEVRNPGRWIVYMGRYDNAEQATRKKAELRALGIDFRDVNTQGLSPGLALGTFSSEDAARQALQQTERRSVRTARVVQERAESVTFTLRLPGITDDRRTAIDGLGVAMAGKTLQTCP